VKNFLFEGKTVQYSNAGSAITSGSVIVLGRHVGVAVVDIAATTGVGSVAIEGVFQLTKKSGEAWAGGVDQLFYDTGNAWFTKTPAAGFIPGGIAGEDALSADVLGSVKIENAQPAPSALQADSVAGSVGALVTDFNALLAKLKAAGIMLNA
jgi:predicted RecA/RadA family phage recombinase